MVLGLKVGALLTGGGSFGCAQDDRVSVGGAFFAGRGFVTFGLGQDRIGSL